MRLFLKITLLYLFISLLVFVFGGMITYQVIKREIDYEQQRFLKERLQWSLHMIEKKHLSKPFERDKISVIPLGSVGVETEIQYSDTLVMHSTLQRMEPHIKLDVVRKVDGQYFKISLYDLIVEEDDIVDGVRESLVKVYLLLFIVVLMLGVIASLIILKPFNATLDKIKNFNLKRNRAIPYKKSSTKEFDNLNRFITEMTEKSVTDYISLKEFTENASHEMQTPLAIASGKLELLMESDNLVNEQIMLISSAQNSLQRLSKLNWALSLLTKIDNKEFENIKEVNLSQLINQLLFDFKELMALKSIEIESSIVDDVKVPMDRELAAIMVNNLFQNAVRHNYQSGKIGIKLDQEKLIICNTGEPLISDPELMFERFKKDNQSKESIGLGLAIVKKICEVNNFHLSYHYEIDEHRISVEF